MLASLLTLLALFSIPALAAESDPQDCDNQYTNYPLTHVPLIQEQTCNCMGKISWLGGVQSGDEFLACPANFQAGEMWAKYYGSYRHYVPLFREDVQDTVTDSNRLCVTMNMAAKYPGQAQTLALNKLSPACWLNWDMTAESMRDGRYAPMVWRLGWAPWTPERVEALAAAYPGKTWLLQNEPEEPSQGNTSPEEAARLMLGYIAAIGDNGRLACCGTHANLNGLPWLDRYLAAGGPVPDVWHIHIYATTVDGWYAGLDQWWAWWERNGSGRPIIISETSAMEANFLVHHELIRRMVNFNDRRIEKIYWFSALREGHVFWWNGYLLMDDLGLTTVGQTYIDAHDALRGD